METAWVATRAALIAAAKHNDLRPRDAVLIGKALAMVLLGAVVVTTSVILALYDENATVQSALCMIITVLAVSMMGAVGLFVPGCVAEHLAAHVAQSAPDTHTATSRDTRSDQRTGGEPS